MKLVFSSIQWALFILMASIIVPITVSELYDFSFAETINFVQRTLFVLGLAGLLHVLIGHRLPIQEGPTNLWWAIFIFFSTTGTTFFSSTEETLSVLQTSLIMSGFIFIIISLVNGLKYIEKIMTPTLLAVYLLLLVIQLSGAFIEGLMGINENNVYINPQILILSILLVGINYFLATIKKIQNFSVLLTIIIGWIIFFILGLTKPVEYSNKLFQIPTMTNLMEIKFYPSVIPLVFSVTILLMMNLIVTVRVVTDVYNRNNQPYPKHSQPLSGIVSGVNQILAGVYSTVGPVPISGSAPFIESTRQFLRVPFIIGSILVISVSFFPQIISILVTIPPAVGYAAIFPIFANMMILSMDLLFSVENRARMYKILSISLFTGTGIMFLPGESFIKISPILTPLISNGLVVGTIVCFILELLIPVSKDKPKL